MYSLQEFKKAQPLSQEPSNLLGATGLSEVPPQVGCAASLGSSGCSSGGLTVWEGVVVVG
jgi:hypothetical protein